VNWTIEVNDVLNKGGCDGLAQYVKTVLNPQLLEIVDLVRGKLNKVQMSTLGALVVIDVHARDTCDNMVDQKVCSFFFSFSYFSFSSGSIILRMIFF